MAKPKAKPNTDNTVNTDAAEVLEDSKLALALIRTANNGYDRGEEYCYIITPEPFDIHENKTKSTIVAAVRKGSGRYSREPKQFHDEAKCWMEARV